MPQTTGKSPKQFKRRKPRVVKKVDLPKFHPAVIEGAILTLEDYLERANINWVALGETCEGVIKERVESNQIDIAARKTNITTFAKSVFQTIAPDMKYEEDKLTFKLNEVPITIHLYDHSNQNYRMFDNPSFTWFKIIQVNIPNPINKYRDMVNSGRLI